MAGCPY